TAAGADAYTRSLHDALPIYAGCHQPPGVTFGLLSEGAGHARRRSPLDPPARARLSAPGRDESLRGRKDSGAFYASPSSTLTPGRSEEHTSELQSREDLVCRL